MNLTTKNRISLIGVLLLLVLAVQFFDSVSFDVEETDTVELVQNDMEDETDTDSEELRYVFHLNAIRLQTTDSVQGVFCPVSTAFRSIVLEISSPPPELI